MRRGTTPTIIYTFPSDLSVGEVVSARLSLCQGRRMIADRGLDSMEIGAYGNTLSIKLSQEESLSLSANRTVDVQLKVKLIGGDVLATPVREVRVQEILSEEVI